MDIEQLAGIRLGNYEIESLLGRGEMGVVYKALQISLNRPVALKILPPTLSSDLSFVITFQREARAGPVIPLGDGWFVLFRFYGPEREYYDKSWKLPDFEKIK